MPKEGMGRTFGPRNRQLTRPVVRSFSLPPVFPFSSLPAAARGPMEFSQCASADGAANGATRRSKGTIAVAMARQTAMARNASA